MKAAETSFETPLLLGSQIFQFLREQIITGKLEEGARLNELSLQKTLGTSRSPIREAFRRLEMEGLVDIIPRRGAFVRSISVADLVEATAVRASLEALALRLAARPIDPGRLKVLSRLVEQMNEAMEKRDIEEFTSLHWRFHQVLIELSGNQILARVHAIVTQPFISRSLTYRFWKRVDQFKGVGHREIVDLLVSGEVLKASRMMEKHAMAFIGPVPRGKKKPGVPETRARKPAREEGK